MKSYIHSVKELFFTFKANSQNIHFCLLKELR